MIVEHATNSGEGRAREIELLSRFEIIGGHQKNIFRSLKHFYVYGCSFAKDLEKSLNINRGTAHRIIEQLVTAGFIEPLTKTNIPSKFGKKTLIYGVFDVTTREVQLAISRDMKYSSRSLRYVDIIYQRTLPDVVNEGIQMSKIMSIARRYGTGSGFHYTDIAKYVANKYQLDGVKVWQ